MSIKLMSAIFEAEFHDLEYVKDGQERKAKASTAKLVLLAIADHANDYGESAYPGYSRLEIKTALSRQGLADTIEALKYNGLLTVDEKPSRLRTNNYTINIRSLPAIARELPDIVKPLDQDESSHLTSASQATLLAPVKPLDSNHHLTINKPYKRGTLVDAVIELSEMPGIKKVNVKLAIESIIKVRLGVNPNGKDWESFIGYAADRQMKDGQSMTDFTTWALENGYDFRFWTARKLQEFWPRAFNNQLVACEDVRV